MFENNAFFFMFGVLVVTVAVMHMVVLMRFYRAKLAEWPDEYFARFDPPIDRHEYARKFVAYYRVAHGAIAVLGIALLGWLMSVMQRPDWDRRWVVFSVMAYFLAQWLPMIFVAILGFRHRQVLKQYLEQPKRRATLRRRGVFDFVSPVTVIVAAAAFPACVALVLYSMPDFSKRAWFIGSLAFDYLLTVVSVYYGLYGPKSVPFETDESRLATIGVRTRVTVYSAIAVAAFMSLVVVITTNDLQNWMPCALAVFLTVVTFVTFKSFAEASQSDASVAHS